MLGGDCTLLEFTLRLLTNLQLTPEFCMPTFNGSLSIYMRKIMFGLFIPLIV